ncbi:deoxynucleoside kinase, partial [bacterium]|nr:deoxynucleoside kinase [bacterium]
LDWLIKINDDFLLPDITILLKVSPEICFKRIKKRNKERTLFEEKEKLNKVWQVYKILPDYFENIFIVDGEKSIEEVFQVVKKIIINHLI